MHPLHSFEGRGSEPSVEEMEGRYSAKHQEKSAETPEAIEYRAFGQAARRSQGQATVNSDWKSLNKASLCLAP